MLPSKNVDLYIYDLISALPIAYFFHYVLITQRYDYLIGLLLTDGVTICLKKLSNFLDNESFLYQITRRPTHGAKCDFLSQISSVKNAPGFPSGHMALTLYFVTILIHNNITEFDSNNNNQNNNENNNNNKTNLVSFCKKYWIQLFMYIILISAMGLARIKKGCHTLLQVIAGSIVGVICAFISIYIEFYRHNHYNNTIY